MSHSPKLKDILSSPVITIDCDASIEQALGMMRQHHISALVVIRQDKPIGIFTERDALLSTLNNKNREPLNSHQLMSKPLVTAPVSMDYRDGYRLITKHGLRHLIVVDESNLLAGIITESNFLKHIGNEFLVRFKEVSAVMTKNVITLATNASVQDAVEIMAQHHISCVVIENQGQPEGIFTERDLVNIESSADTLLSQTITQVMSTPVQCVEKNETLPKAIQMMDELAIRRLVIVDEKNSIAGLITRSDIVKQLYDRHIEHLQQILKDRNLELQQVHEKLRMVNKLYQAQEALNEKQLKLDLALDAGKICTWDWDTENNLVYGDNRLIELFKLDPDRAKNGIPIEELFASIERQDHELIQQRINDSINDGKLFNVEFRVHTANGLRFLLTRGQTTRDKKNQVIRIIGAIADITDQKIAQNTILQHEKELRSTQRIARLGHWELDINTFIAEWSEEIHQLLGTSQEQQVGPEFLAQIVHPDDWPEVQRSLKNAIQHGKKHELEYRVKSIDGSEHWVFCKAEQVKDNKGKLIKLKGILQDITDRKKSAEKIRLSANVFENTLEGVFITNTDGIIEEVNPAFSDITGYTREEIIGQSPSIFRSGKHGAEFYNEIWNSLKNSGQWRGEIWNRRKDGSCFPEWQNISSVLDEHGKQTHYVSVFSDISQIKQSQEKLDYLAHHDALTDLPNRLLLNERLNQAIRHAQRQHSQLAIFFLDLDHFKHINDSMGHPAGDELLKTVANNLVNAVRQDDTVSRIGGDEFVILLEDIGKPENAGLMAEKLLSIFEETFSIEEREIRITASLGICLYPQDGDNAETLLRNADSAMYRAKEEGRNTYQFYTAELTRNAFERVLLENNLRMAIQNNEFLLYYQPQKNLLNNRIIGVEALIRWQHPELGMISPVRFIPIAEDSGLIFPISNWVLNTACKQAKQWLDQGLDFGKIAVNISGLQIQRGTLIDEVKLALETSQLPAFRLELEVTEGFIMQHAEDAISQLNALRKLGVTLSIDDFGTGYSSLSYLKQLPIQKLKIDQSFVHDIPQDPNDMAIADAVIAMGKSLGLTVIAEGIETEQQVDFLKQCGCQEGQGFLYSKPVNAELLTQLLK